MLYICRVILARNDIGAAQQQKGLKILCIAVLTLTAKNSGLNFEKNKLS